MRGRWAAILAVILLSGSPAAGMQARTPEPQDEQPAQLRPQATSVAPVGPGRVAGSTVGIAGQRQSREQAAPAAQPMARIVNRIQNRVQNRIRTRIDRNYDPQVNAASPFGVAQDQARSVGPRRH